MTPRFSIGDAVWIALWEATTSSVECPDCGGQGRIRCLLPDDTIVSVECEGCRHGFEPSNGRVNVYDRSGGARLTTVTGMEIREDKIEYRTSSSYIVASDDLFETEPEAVARSAEKATEADREERERVARKEKPTRSWSWNVHYHRREIREAERRIAYHTAKLAVARVKAKEPA